MFSQFAGNYESLVEILCCAIAVALGFQAVRRGDYLWAGGLGMVAIVFSPLSLVNKVFTLMAYMAIVTLLSLWAALRAGPVAPDEDEMPFDDTLSFAGVQRFKRPVDQSAKEEEDACRLESISSGFWS
jgi:hypothetical protein